MGRVSGGPWRHGVATTSIGRRPGASSRVVAHGASPTGGAAEPRRARHGGDHDRHVGQQRAPAVVEVVGVVVVGEQHGVDRAELVDGARAGPATLVDPVPHPNA